MMKRRENSVNNLKNQINHVSNIYISHPTELYTKVSNQL